MVAAAPFIIVLGAAGAAGLLFFAFWDRCAGLVNKLTSTFRADIERADLKLSSEQLTYGIVGFAVIGWLFFIVLVHPNIGIALVTLPVAVGVIAKLCQSWLKGKVKARVKAFNNQLELILRMIGNGLRVGLGLRQALSPRYRGTAEPRPGGVRANHWANQYRCLAQRCARQPRVPYVFR